MNAHEQRDARIATFRWCKTNRGKKIHLWLGQSSACGLRLPEDVHTLEVAYPDPSCGKCWAYAEGWLDRHDLGANPPLSRSPIGAATRLTPVGAA